MKVIALIRCTWHLELPWVIRQPWKQWHWPRRTGNTHMVVTISNYMFLNVIAFTTMTEICKWQDKVELSCTHLIRLQETPSV